MAQLTCRGSSRPARRPSSTPSSASQSTTRLSIAASCGMPSRHGTHFPQVCAPLACSMVSCRPAGTCPAASLLDNGARRCPGARQSAHRRATAAQSIAWPLALHPLSARNRRDVSTRVSRASFPPRKRRALRRPRAQRRGEGTRAAKGADGSCGPNDRQLSHRNVVLDRFDKCLHAQYTSRTPSLRQFHHQERWRLQWKTGSPS